MIILSCNGIFKSFGINLILENIGFSINIGERIGLVGANGSGKTTLFKILTGQYTFDSGELYLSKDITLGYMEQSAMSESGLTVYEETLLVFDQLIKMEDEL
ncbi:MAG: ABC-F family ATP-binding cassette domain-containing protein, partial [Alkaliphilus sp.]|nr:ABC-F family ATP-binding cassette domain-containing protein [Alkaliphilus sp.]